jgi:hypothetical protein
MASRHEISTSVHMDVYLQGLGCKAVDVSKTSTPAVTFTEQRERDVTRGIRYLRQRDDVGVPVDIEICVDLSCTADYYSEYVVLYFRQVNADARYIWSQREATEIWESSLQTDPSWKVAVDLEDKRHVLGKCKGMLQILLDDNKEKTTLIGGCQNIVLSSLLYTGSEK